MWILGSPSQNVYGRNANSVKKKPRDGQRFEMATVKEIILLYVLIWKVVGKCDIYIHVPQSGE